MCLYTGHLQMAVAGGASKYSARPSTFSTGLGGGVTPLIVACWTTVFNRSASEAEGDNEMDIGSQRLEEER